MESPVPSQLQLITLERGLTAVRCPATMAERGRILFLHGMMAGAWQFEALQPFFAERGYTSLALNYRGHHGSSPVTRLADVSVRDYVEDALVAARMLERPIVLGQSMGGLIAQKLMEADVVSAAVLLCSLPPRGILWLGGYAHFIASLRTLPAILGRSQLQPHRASLDKTIFNCLSPARRQALFLRQVPESSRAGFEIAMGLIGVDAARVRCQVLSVGAEHDRLVSPSRARHMATKYRGKWLELERCGHYALVGEADWLPRAQAIAHWIERLGEPTSCNSQTPRS
jgi:pimeloyl-ACP methyl ester carboxylesterase